MAAYRIASEALANAVRHSGTQSCVLTLSVAEGALRVSVRDDGTGVPAGVRAGVGLDSMRAG